MTKLSLVVNCWIGTGTKRVPFGAADAKGLNWYRVEPRSDLVCRCCGGPAAGGWRRGQHGRRAFCTKCVQIREP